MVVKGLGLNQMNQIATLLQDEAMLLERYRSIKAHAFGSTSAVVEYRGEVAVAVDAGRGARLDIIEKRTYLLPRGKE